jgi:hypothetical protein
MTYINRRTTPTIRREYGADIAEKTNRTCEGAGLAKGACGGRASEDR